MDKITFSVQFERLAGVFGSKNERMDTKMDEYYSIFKNTKMEHLENAVDYLLNNHRISRLPVPADIWTALASCTPKGANEFDQIDNGCKRCEGTGFVYTEKNYGTNLGIPLLSEYAFRCNCSAGQMRSRGILEWEEIWEKKGHKLKWGLT